MMRLVALVGALMAAAPLSAKQPACVLPPPDGSDIEWSPSSVAGRISIVKSDVAVIRTASGISYSVAIDEATDLFTAYGGGLEFADIRPGQYADVWLQDCKPPSKSITRAAVIRVCSLDPEPCPASK